MNNRSAVTLVIADDEAFIRRGLIEIVTGEEWNTELAGTADNGNDALELILTRRPDIAVMDIKMPGLDGLEVIRRANEAGVATRFLILSGYNDFAFAQKAIKYHVKDYFLKPLNIPEFKQVFLQQYEDIVRQRTSKSNLSQDELSSLVASSRSYYLSRLLQNESSGQDYGEERLSFLHLEIKNEPLCAAVFIPASAEAESEIDFNAVLEDGILPVLSRLPSTAWLYKEQEIVCIINLKEGQENLIAKKLKDCIETINSRFGVRFIAGCGTSVSDLSQCPVSYRSALQALSYRIYETGLCLYDSTIICQENPASPSRSVDSAPLTAAVLKNREEEIKTCCTAFFESLFFVRMPPPNYIYGMFMFLITNVQKDIGILRGSTADLPSFTFEDLNSLASVRQLKDWLVDFFLNYSRNLNKSESSHDRIIQTAKEYIRSHLDQKLSAREVAASVSLSEAYFTIYFKNHSGVNFRDYVLNEKMEYAKSLIASRKHSIAEIAYAAGYQDYRSFSRAFKNVVGVTPSEYLNTADRTADRNDS